jgi:3-phosphoshikimate 1-carboxyvinyltransferase
MSKDAQFFTPLSSHKSTKLLGKIKVPGDKSISHRALMLGSIALGKTTITGLLEGEDVLRTAEAMRRMGASVIRHDKGEWEIRGQGIGALHESDDILDMGNAGTGARLIMGLVASHPIVTFFTGDSSLRSRPMKRIIEPLRQMGCHFIGHSGDVLPLAVIGSDRLIPITYETPVPSAQVKSALLFAGLNVAGKTIVIERESTRDHSELMLRGFGAQIDTEFLPEGGRMITLTGHPELLGRHVIVPADPSSSAFPVIAALLCPHSKITLLQVCKNPLRTGLFTTLEEMGATLDWQNVREEGGEIIGDLSVEQSSLKAVDVPASRAPSMIDEYPILAVAASFAEGTTRLRGLSELRVKESDRLESVAKGLQLCGVQLTIEGDDLVIYGTGKAPKGGAMITTHFDHRIAMSFLIMGLATQETIKIDDSRSIETSFPGFVDLMTSLGAQIN